MKYIKGVFKTIFWSTQIVIGVEADVTKFVFGTVKYMRNNKRYVVCGMWYVLLKLGFTNTFNTT